MNQESFEELFEQSITGFAQGEIINGKVANISADNILIDIGYKSEGKISTKEFEELPTLGDNVKVMVIKMENHEGNIVLSKKQADIILNTRKIKENYTKNKAIQGKIIKKIKGGYIVSVGGVEGFLPLSLIEINWKKTTQNLYLNKNFKFKVLQYEPDKNNLIFSRKHYLEEELKIKRDNILQKIKKGSVVEVKIKQVKDYKTIVDFNKILEGFIHLKDISWAHIKNCSSILRENQKIKAKILAIDAENYKLQFGIKQLTEDPWIDFAKEKNIGNIISGEVTKLTNFGAFIKIINGIEGLIHITEMSWTKRINHPKEILKEGNHVKTKIIEVNKENRKLLLSLRQIVKNPWENIEEEYPKGKKIKGKIINIEEFGAFIQLDNELVGLLHKNDVNWIKKISNLKENSEFKKGSKIDVIILDINKENKTISLGLKQLLKNPYEIFKANHPKNSIIKTKVQKITESGMIMILDKNIEGFLHISEINKKRDQSIKELYKIGDTVNVMIKNIDLQKNKIYLSIKNYEKQQEQKTINQYLINSKEAQKNSISLGDMINLNKLK